MADGGVVFTLERAGEQVAFSPDGRWIATLADRRLAEAWTGAAVRFWDAATGRPAFTFRQTRERAAAFGFSPDGKRLAVVGATVSVFDVTDSGLRPALAFEEEGQCLAFSLEPGNNLAGIHAQLDNLERYTTFDRFLLLGGVDCSKTAFADSL